MRFRFTIRDLLWLALVAALAVGWWVDRERLKPKTMMIAPSGMRNMDGRPGELLGIPE